MPAKEDGAPPKNGVKTIPAIVREYSDIETTEIALIENLQRENLNAIEEAGAYQRLVNEFGLTQEELAKKLGAVDLTLLTLLDYQIYQKLYKNMFHVEH